MDGFPASATSENSDVRFFASHRNLVRSTVCQPRRSVQEVLRSTIMWMRARLGPVHSSGGMRPSDGALQPKEKRKTRSLARHRDLMKDTEYTLKPWRRSDAPPAMRAFHGALFGQVLAPPGMVVLQWHFPALEALQRLLLRD